MPGIKTRLLESSFRFASLLALTVTVFPPRRQATLVSVGLLGASMVRTCPNRQFPKTLGCSASSVVLLIIFVARLFVIS